MTEQTAAPTVVRNEERSRYEAWFGDTLAGIAAYREHGDRTVFTHTEVDAAFKGKGVAKALAATALDDVVRRGHVIVPACPFIADYLTKHGQYEEHVRRPDGS